MARRVTRSLCDVRDLQPGEYLIAPANTLGPRSIWYRCLGCGTLIDLDDEETQHTIDASGRVSPAVECPAVECDTREWLELDGFDFSDVAETKPYVKAES